MVRELVRGAVGYRLREAEPMAVRDTSRSHVEKLIDGYLTKNPGSHFASEITEALGLDFRTTIEAIKRMIDSGKIHRARN
jgi:hypothetical protein